MATYEEAIDLIYGRFRTAWNAQATAIAGYLPEVKYEGVEDDKNASQSKIWSRVSTRGVIGRQATLGTPQVGKHEYETVGLVTVQIFLPKKDATAITKGRRLAQVAQNAYRSIAAGDEVWFRDATIKEQPPETSWYQINVTAEYNFMETV
jgi:hypothetical protein